MSEPPRVVPVEIDCSACCGTGLLMFDGIVQVSIHTGSLLQCDCRLGTGKIDKWVLADGERKEQTE